MVESGFLLCVVASGIILEVFINTTSREEAIRGKGPNRGILFMQNERVAVQDMGDILGEFKGDSRQVPTTIIEDVLDGESFIIMVVRSIDNASQLPR